MAHLAISLLGPFQATLDEEPIAGFEANKVRALLAYLALEAHRHPEGYTCTGAQCPGGHPRQVLATLLWPDKPERAALANLRNALANLRSAIGDRDATPPYLQITRETIQFNRASDHRLDVAAFQALVQITPAETAMEETVGADRPAHQRLQEAATLYRGDFLEGFFVRDSPQFEDWVLLLREKLHWQALGALDALAAYHEGCGAYQEAIACARRQVVLEPWQERAHRQWMRALALSGHRGAALTQYATCCQVLADELGIEPEPATTILYEQIREGTIGAVQDAAPEHVPTLIPQESVGVALSSQASTALPLEGTAALTALPLDASLDVEQRMVTIVRADVSGSAALRDRLDTKERAAIIGQVLCMLEAEAARFEGKVDRHARDGLVACFGATTAHEDDPERAVLAALAMQERFGALLVELTERGQFGGPTEDLRLLVAVHTGPVVVTATEEDGPRRDTAMEKVLAFMMRVQIAAEPGEVWVSEITRRLVEPLFEWALRGEISPGADAQTLSISCALGRRASADKMRGIAGLSSPLIGRDIECHTLQDLIERLRDGIGGIATVVGEAGIGKSRLVAEVRQIADRRPSDGREDPAFRHSQGADAEQGETLSANRGLSWTEGRCLSYSIGIAYSLWIDALHKLLSLHADAPPQATAEALQEQVFALCSDRAGEVYPFLARMMSLPLTGSAKDRLGGVEGEGLQVLTFRAVETLIECAAQREPLVLVCEDLHWADPTSLALLDQLLPLTDRIPVLFICVFRPEKDHGCWRIKERADRLYEHRHTDLWLGPLAVDQSAQLVGSLLHIEHLPQTLRSQILDRAEGNPFYVEEILRSLIDDGVIAFDELGGQWQVVREVGDLALPDTLRGVLMARIDRLPRGTRQVLRLASVVGRSFTYPVLSAMASPRPGGQESGVKVLDTHLIALQRAQMVHEQSRVPEATYAFKHQLTLEAAYDGLLWRKRRVLHRRVAEALEQLFPERVEEQPGLLARHWERAGESARAIPYLHRAGDRAAAQFANTEAVEYFSHALDLVPEEGEDRYVLLLARERVHESQRDREAQGQDLVTLGQLAEVLGDKAKQAEVAVRQARYCTRTGERDQAISAARTAVRLARDAQDVGREAMAYREWGRALFSQKEHEAALPLLERALTLAQDAGLHFTEAEVLQTLGAVLYNLGDAERGTACYERALRVCRQIGDRKREGEALRNVAWVLLLRVNWSESEAYLQQLLNVSRETGNWRNEAWAILSLGMISYHRGHYDRSRNEHEQGLHIFREVRDPWGEGEAIGGLGFIYTALSDYATARDYLEQTLRLERQIDNRLGEAWTLVHLGLVFHLQGDYVSAEAHYEQALHIGRKIDDREIEAKALMYTGLLFHHRGDNHAAQAYSQQALRAIPNLDLRWAVDLQYAFAVLGHALVGLGRPAEAAKNYRQCLTMRREREQHHLTVEPLAGLACVALAQKDPAGALAQVGEILDYMTDHPALHGTLEPLRIYLTCYRVLLANEDRRADEILDAAYHLLHERAATIENENLRRSYLMNVAAHREIAALWEKASRL